MYARFYRWAFDRLDNNGIVAFITNRSFIDSRTFDGFRKIIRQDFEAAYIIDTRSDVRANPKIAGTTHNVFGIQTGVAIMFLIKKQNRENETCKIHYMALDDFWRREQKLQWLAENPLKDIPFEIIRPDRNNNWINLSENDFEELLPLCSKNAKLGRGNETLFELFSLGVVTARDEWVYDHNKKHLSDKIKFLIDVYNKELVLHKDKIKDIVDYSIKWSRAVKNDLSKGKKYIFNKKDIVESLYRPFVKKKLYFNKELIEMRYQLNAIFQDENISISFLCVNSSNELAVMSTNILFDYCLLKKGNGGTQCLPLYRYDKNGVRIDNITDWGLQQFVNHYGDESISKENVFHYVYAVLHNPAYRKKYETNLKREFPRIPFYDDFRQWTAWGKALMHLHVDYEHVTRYPLRVVETGHDPSQSNPKPKLKADKSAGVIQLDEQTELHNIPVEAWEYRLGNRSALEWILDQYQEKKPKDPTIVEKFNAYRFADYKEQVIDLLMRVCTVSVETMRIVGEMENAGLINDSELAVRERIQKTLKS
jgi:predicted helicase